ncbi:MAG TPA: PH domain-containing protein [Stellaceae bacterium]|nr:PH domain-containing protein [Stellaceae bacterium]
MNYVTRVLQPGENVIHVTRMHPIIFLPAIFWLVAALAMLIAGLSLNGDLRIAGEALAAFFGIFALAAAIPALIRRGTTELAVTDRRVIYKSGIISRHTLEMNRSKVESVDVDQSLMGRFLGFGTIVVRGTGGSLEPIRMISDPLSFRSHITAG